MAATNGVSTPPTSASSPSSLEKSQAILNDLRLSGESERSSPPSNSPVLNGKHPPEATTGSDGNDVETLQQELARTREEKESLASQYRNLLAKLTTMRTTLGNKLKQDAEELDRREQEIQSLSAQNEDLSGTVETLKEELISSSAEIERATTELDRMRNQTLHENAQETMRLERELREAQTELERCRLERDEWERSAQEERVTSEEARALVDDARRDLEIEREARERDAGELESERERASNLQSVLQDFQAAKEHELRQAVKDYDGQLNQVTQSLAEFKSRALNAELKLEETTSNSSRVEALEKEVKDKGLLIQKLRHEGEYSRHL